MSRNTSLSMPRWHDEGFRRIEGEFADPRLRAQLAMHNAGSWLW